jgi:hypothetical protein
MRADAMAIALGVVVYLVAAPFVRKMTGLAV